MHDEIIFVRGTTEGINLVAQTYGRTNVKAGDEIVISAMEHHSNIVPWQMLCEEKGAKLRVIPINDRGELLLEEYEKLLNPRTRLVAVSHVSNALGTINPVREIVEMAHRPERPGADRRRAGRAAHEGGRAGARCDFYAFSGHKMFGPTGIGVLYGKDALLEAMPPYQGGGDMIRSVTFEKTTYNELPYKFEAGTPDIAGVIGLGAAIDYLDQIGMDNIAAYEHDLLAYGTRALESIPGLRLIGTAREKAGVLSFVIEGVHPHDIGTMLDRQGIAVRTGHHCAQPVMERFGIPATTRASLAFYNTSGRNRRAGGGHPQGQGDLRSMIDDLYQEIILDHSKRPRNCQLHGGRESQGRGLQSAVRRQAASSFSKNTNGVIVKDVSFQWARAAPSRPPRLR